MHLIEEQKRVQQVCSDLWRHGSSRYERLVRIRGGDNMIGLVDIVRALRDEHAVRGRDGDGHRAERRRWW